MRGQHGLLHGLQRRRLLLHQHLLLLLGRQQLLLLLLRQRRLLRDQLLGALLLLHARGKGGLAPAPMRSVGLGSGYRGRAHQPAQRRCRRRNSTGSPSLPTDLLQMGMSVSLWQTE